MRIKARHSESTSINRSSIFELSKAFSILSQHPADMKYFAIALFALVAVAAVAEAKPTGEVESIEPAARAESTSPEAARNKRGLLLSAAYTAPLAYSAYTAPAVAYSAYSYPYAYTAYSSYPYYAGAYSAPYYLA
ncbi:uncharacterized protein LOC105195966 [Solenopsis invicta]|uniref:uncharacterized protein LOC105195966 n=1 Tax=Solenopsis invicta TaxID=13686 RepID=UPI00193D8C85|nr:uncharacterized protein LOC105195966 [Solenopsis invicta]